MGGTAYKNDSTVSCDLVGGEIFESGLKLTYGLRIMVNDRKNFEAVLLFYRQKGLKYLKAKKRNRQKKDLYN